MSVVEGKAAGKGEGEHDAVISGEMRVGAMARDSGIPVLPTWWCMMVTMMAQLVRKA